MTELHPVIFGDNQFFGINHHSEAKARELTERFGPLPAITRVYEDCWDLGIRGFMINANPRADEICDWLRANGPDDMVLYPSIPYPHKYAAAVNEKGLFAALQEFSGDDGTLAFATRGAAALLSRDLVPLMRTLVDLEMHTFRGMNIRVLFLQNILTDLLIGVGARAAVTAYAEHLREKWKVEPGFLTMNLPSAVPFLHSCGLDEPVVCGSINKAGYFMNPSIEAVEHTLRTERCQPIAMSILASGGIGPVEAVDYVASLPVRSVVFGASTRAHIAQTADLIRDKIGR